MKIVFILAVAAVVTNLFYIWYAKRKRVKKKADESSNPNVGLSQEFINSAEGKTLKQAAADEMGIAVEELDRMSVEEITQLAKKKELI